MTSTDDSEPHKFDVYARPFVPQALKDVNEAPANVVPCAPVKWIDFNRYTSTFAGTEFFDNAGPKLQPKKVVPSSAEPLHITSNSQVTEAEAPPRSQQDSGDEEDDDIEPLEPHVYHHYFRTALVNEAAGQQSECEDHTLYRVRVAKMNPKVDPRSSLYILNVPGLRELSLRIDVGDVVQLRQIRFNQQGEILSGSLIRDAAGNPIDLPRKHDTQHNGVVWAIDRLKEELSLRIDNLTPRSMLFNAKFTTQSSRFKAMYNAVITTQNALSTSDDCWMRSMLFPEASDGHYQKTLNRREHDLDLCDQLLNYEQSRAVATVVNETYGPVPYVISGPPGTGKTKTIVELALQLLKQHNAHLLMCAPSDPAADTLVQRLSKRLKPAQLLRINSPARNFPEVPTTVLPFCFVDDGMFSLPPFIELMRKSVVVTTCRDADILVRARVANRDLCCFEQNLHAAIHPQTTPKRQKFLHWTGLLLDEAAQATEPEALIPLSVVVPPDEHDIPDKRLPLFIMAGDQHQLGPRTASKGSNITTSLLERLLDRPFYAEHPLARSRQSGGVMRPLTQAMLPMLRPAFTNLIRNYRSHPAILATPSKLFYNDTLEPEAAGTDALSEWVGWQGRGWPVLFSCNKSSDEVERDGGGWYNNEEAIMACQYAASLLQSGLVEAHDICIMSPFRAQVRVLRKLARSPAFAMSAVNIGPLEAFQGLEKRVVIICTTRTRDRFLDQDLAKGLGVIHEPRRFNVALTRAMHGLIAIGNPFLLDKDENWRNFMAFCERNGLWEDKSGSCETWQPEVPETSGMISRLEKQMVRKEDEGDEVEDLSEGVRRLGLFRDPEQELWQSGVEAEMAIGEEE